MASISSNTAAGDEPDVLTRQEQHRVGCVFQAIADGYFSASQTAFQTDRGRRFKLIVDAVSA